MSIAQLNAILCNPEKMLSVKARLALNVREGLQDDCWPWMGKSVAKYGYGRLTAGRGIYLRAHQVAWALSNGAIPESSVVRHSCDNPCCCNPAHLIVGTQLENVSDCIHRGRKSPPPLHKGASSPNAKLALVEVVEIRSGNGGSLKEAAQIYGVSSKTIWRIRKGLAWAT